MRRLGLLLICTLLMMQAPADAQRVSPAGPGLSATPAKEMDRSAVMKELDAIAQGYLRRTDLVQLMANGTLLKFYPRKLVRCGDLRTTVYDCLHGEWPDLKDFKRSFFFSETGEPRRRGFTAEEVIEIERRHFDMVARLNTLLVAVRYESTLKPEARYEARLSEMRQRLTALDKEDAAGARMMSYILYGIAGLIILTIIGVATFLVMRVSRTAARQRAARIAEERAQVDDY